MASTRPRLWWLAAPLVGVAVGVLGYLIAPLPIGANAVRTPRSPVTTPAGTPTRTPTAESPPFTRAALLQPDEFRRFGWGKAELIAISDGTRSDLPSLCVAPQAVADGSVESYSAEYRGLQTHALEIVVREADAETAKRSYDRLTGGIADCASAQRIRRSTPTIRHDPQLPDVRAARWWQVAVPSGAAGLDRPARGVIAVARMDDRLVYLVLTSATSDPATTVQFEALLTRSALRLV